MAESGTIGAPRHRTDHELLTGFARRSRRLPRAASAKASRRQRAALRGAPRADSSRLSRRAAPLQPDGHLPRRHDGDLLRCAADSAHVSRRSAIASCDDQLRIDYLAASLARGQARRLLRATRASSSCKASCRRTAIRWRASAASSRSARRSTIDDGVGQRLLIGASGTRPRRGTSSALLVDPLSAAGQR